MYGDVSNPYNLMEDLKKKRTRINEPRHDFSDKELQDEMADEIDEIRARNISQLEKDKLIADNYEQKKKLKRNKQLQKQKDRIASGARGSGLPKKVREADDELHMDEREEGEINENAAISAPEQNENISLNDLADNIKPIVLTRSKLEDMLRLPRFQELIKGCFVRCNCDKTSTNNNYMLAEIKGTVETQDYYTIVRATTNIKILLQLGNKDVQSLNMSVVSNQPLSSTLEIDRWFNRNRENIPKVEDLKRKREMLQRELQKNISNEEIDNNIMRNIERVIRKTKESKSCKQDVSYFLSFLQNKNHHLEKSIKDHEYMSGYHEEQSNVAAKSGVRKRKYNDDQPAVKKPLVDLATLQKEKGLVEQYYHDIKEIQKQQNEKRGSKREQQQQQQRKMDQIISSYSNSAREDYIAGALREQIHQLSIAGSRDAIRKRILNDHAKRILNITI